MADDASAGDSSQADGVKTGIKLSAGALEAVTKNILEDILYDITTSIVLSTHRSEKVLRMSSAATAAESLAISSLDPSIAKSQTSSQPPAPPTASTHAAEYSNGRVFLKGNPLATTPEILCPHCKLPRLMYPIMGKGMQAPDLSKEYCMLYPWVSRPGHDVFGNPFPTDMAKSKKERELMRQQQKNAEKESVGTPNSQDTDMNGPDGNGGAVNKLNTGGKPANYIPWHTCPNCKRSLLITRFAQHLEKCLGISGRQSSRNAMAKLAGQNGVTASSTPLGSRMGTPAPGSQSALEKNGKGKSGSPVKKDLDDDGDDDSQVRKKKKSSYIKKADRERMAKESAPLKVKLKSGKDKGDEKEGKREREGDGDDAPRKKLKLSLGKDSKDDEQSTREVSEAASNINVGDGD